MERNAPIVIMPALQELFYTIWEQCQVILFSSPTGFGKTTVANSLLIKHSVCAYNAFERDFLAKPIESACGTVLIDDLQQVQHAKQQQAICDLINKNPDKHFVLLGRGIMPGWLMPFQCAGVLRIIDVQSLTFTRSATGKLLEQSGIKVSNAELTVIQHETQGYPLAVALLCRLMSNGLAYSEVVANKIKQEIFLHFDKEVYRRLDPPIRHLLLDLSPFEQFNSELAKMVSGDGRVGELLGYLQCNSNMMMFVVPDQYRFWPAFRDFLLWELRQERNADEQDALYSRVGLYYELEDDYAHALDSYSRGGNHCKVKELLIKYAEHHPGVGQFYEMEDYYYALPKEEVLRSSALMCGMSMVTSLNMEYEASENWYKELQSYAARLKKSDCEYKDARSKLAYLDIALPQRGSKDLMEIISSVFNILTTKELTLPTFSVTSSLPSLLNGGKDFSEWTKHDDLLYKTMRKPVETILGRDGVGLADCAICESKFEKGEDISARLLTLVARASEIHCKGTPDIEFAVIGLLVRQQVVQGKAAAALKTLENLRDEFLDEDQTRFLDNLDAMRCRIWLRLGMLDDAEEWLRTKAPPCGSRLRGLWRYRYLTRAMVEITNGDCDNALLILARLLPFTKQCARTLDALTIRLLMAICYFRLENEEWKSKLGESLDTACEYNYIRPISQLGAAVLPLLNACDWNKDKEYFARLLIAARNQTVLYPDFMRTLNALSEPLSQTEMQVLRLICFNRSNQEIGDVLGIKVATVKTHVNHILQKMGVKRRSEAKAMAETLHLL
ncbi:MAG: LuxR C-terminal-related transcriptional regulator [Clostridia bacterium]